MRNSKQSACRGGGKVFGLCPFGWLKPPLRKTSRSGSTRIPHGRGDRCLGKTGYRRGFSGSVCCHVPSGLRVRGNSCHEAPIAALALRAPDSFETPPGYGLPIASLVARSLDESGQTGRSGEAFVVAVYLEPPAPLPAGIRGRRTRIPHGRGDSRLPCQVDDFRLKGADRRLGMQLRLSQVIVELHGKPCTRGTDARHFQA